MFYTKYSNKLINELIKNPTILNIVKRNVEKNVKKHKIIRKFIKKIYNDIMEADIFLYKSKNENDWIKNIEKVNNISQVSKYYNDTDRFLPVNIKNKIEKKSTYIINYKYKIKGKEVKIAFISFDEDIPQFSYYDNYVSCIYMWLYILSTYRINDYKNNIHITIFLTDERKVLPNSLFETLNVEHINTGYTVMKTNEDKINIFRKEEWFKVFIHETFHHFNLDFNSNKYPITKNNIKKIFPIQSDFLLEETYCETWARIINTSFCCYFILNKRMILIYFITIYYLM